MQDLEFDRPLNLKSLLYYKKLNNQLDREVGDMLRERTNHPTNYSNDLRHQYVSALYARNLGADVAKKAGDWNEILNFSGSGRLDTETDQINNEIGRNYGLKYPNASRKELFDYLFEDWGKNSRETKQKLSR